LYLYKKKLHNILSIYILIDPKKYLFVLIRSL
jgi:hypothetical protein